MKLVELNRSLSDFPTTIKWEIFCRLPIKICLTCKLVCRDWYNIITSREFSDFRRSYACRFTLLLHNDFIIQRNNIFHLVEVNKALDVNNTGNIVVDLDNMISFRPRFGIPNEKLYMVGQCNGFVCLVDWVTWGPYYIFNLLTGECICVEPPLELSRCTLGLAFGCCPVTNQFKILISHRLNKPSEKKYGAKVNTVGTVEWRSVGYSPISGWLDGCTLNGAIHRYAHTNGNCIWSFHFGTETFSSVPVPGEIKSTRTGRLTVFDSCLCVSQHSWDGLRRDIWVMKKYGVRSSWVKQFVIQGDINYEPSLRSMPLQLMNKGKILMVCGREFTLYEPESEVHEKLMFDELPVFSCVEEFHANFSGF